MVRFSTLLILEAVSKRKAQLSPRCFRELETLSPFPFKALKKIRVEDLLLDVVHNQLL